MRGEIGYVAEKIHGREILIEGMAFRVERKRWVRGTQSKPDEVRCAPREEDIHQTIENNDERTHPSIP